MKDWINFLFGAGSVVDISPRPMFNRFGRHLFGASIEDDIRGDVEQIGWDMRSAIVDAVGKISHDKRSATGIRTDSAIGEFIGPIDRDAANRSGIKQRRSEDGQTTFGWFA